MSDFRTDLDERPERYSFPPSTGWPSTPKRAYDATWAAKGGVAGPTLPDGTKQTTQCFLVVRPRIPGSPVRCHLWEGDGATQHEVTVGPGTSVIPIEANGLASIVPIGSVVGTNTDGSPEVADDDRELRGQIHQFTVFSA